MTRTCSTLSYNLGNRRHPRHLTRAAGFTLVELMVVVVIIGILATTVTLSVTDYLVKAKRNAAESEIATLRNALSLFYMEHDRYPSNDEGLNLLKQKSSDHGDGFITSDLNDPWGRPYVYIYPGVHGVYDIVSFGADGQEGGTGADADVTSWNLDDTD